ncbi:hypothetical protein CCP4SC76_1630005 [Gammaproteobacteria bacterium]
MGRGLDSAGTDAERAPRGGHYLLPRDTRRTQTGHHVLLRSGVTGRFHTLLQRWRSGGFSSLAGDGPDGVDCSGLVRYSYQQLSIELPRTSIEQFHSAWPVELSEARPGDLLFFRGIGSEAIGHVGIYDGHGGFVHAASKHQQVTYSSLENPYWKPLLIRVGRVF